MLQVKKNFLYITVPLMGLVRSIETLKHRICHIIKKIFFLQDSSTPFLVHQVSHYFSRESTNRHLKKRVIFFVNLKTVHYPRITHTVHISIKVIWKRLCITESVILLQCHCIIVLCDL